MAGASRTNPDVLGAATAATAAELERLCQSSVGSVRREFVERGLVRASWLWDRNSAHFLVGWLDFFGFCGFWFFETVSVARVV